VREPSKFQGLGMPTTQIRRAEDANCYFGGLAETTAQVQGLCAIF
jgi:hypothetical protein